MSRERLYIFDTTLRDGAQTQGVDFSVEDKRQIALALDTLGVAYVEGGWPGANPTDDAFFAAPPAFERARLTAFGMTRRPGRSAGNDPGLAALLGNPAPSVCMVGKAWDFHVDVALGIARNENIAMIGESVAHARARGRETMFDAEHFFDGYKSNPAYALVILLSRVITSLGTLDHINPKTIEGLFAGDLAFLQDLYRRVNETGSNVAHARCPHCEKEFDVELESLGEFGATPLSGSTRR